MGQDQKRYLFGVTPQRDSWAVAVLLAHIEELHQIRRACPLQKRQQNNHVFFGKAAIDQHIFICVRADQIPTDTDINIAKIEQSIIKNGQNWAL